MDIGEDIRKILLVGIGAAAETAERSRDIVNELVKKGELTLEQGKILNEELKRNMEDKVKEHVTVTVNKKAPDDVKKAVENMNGEELEQLKAKIAEVEEKRKGKAADGQGNAGK